MSQDIGVLLLAECRGGELATITAELVTAGRKISDELGYDLAALLIGTDLGDCARRVVELGVGKVYVADDPALVSCVPERLEALVIRACAELRPKVVLMGHTEMGRDLGPRLAFGMDIGLASNCVDICFDPESGSIRATRPVFGGKALGLFSFEKTRPALATIGRKVFEPAPVDVDAQGEVIPFSYAIDAGDTRTAIVERVTEDAGGIRLEDAAFVVSGGRGMGGSEGFAELKKLAAVFGGCIGSSRPPVDSGWVPSSLQVGLTGTVISPKVYLAVGISGAAQHMAGCMAAKTIVAINRDAEAPIFQRAHFGAVGDWKEILPLLTEKCTDATG